MKRNPLVAIALLLSANIASAELVSKESIQRQVNLTHKSSLPNKIPVVVRNVDSSDILVVDVSFKSGIRDFPDGKKALNQFVFKGMPFGGKEFPKEKLYALTEKESIGLECEGGIEISHCSVAALSEQLDVALRLLADVILHPEFDKSAMENLRARLVSEQLSTMQNPDKAVNEIVNQVYYPKGHPYRMDSADAAVELKKMNLTELKKTHDELLDASLMQIVAVTNLPTAKILPLLAKHFGAIANHGKIKKRSPVHDPKYVAAHDFVLNNRDVPTAYMRAKFPVPGQTHKDATATRLTFEILSDELTEEIRTRRSLSYAVFAAPIQHTIGIGLLSASTPKPKETLEAMVQVLHKVMTKPYTKEQLEEYKTGFITNYYLTLENHVSLATALGTSLAYFNDANELYSLPQKLDKLNAADVQRIAKQYIKQMRLGVLFLDKSFDKKWANSLLAL